ncbi:MAG: hypothetical protein E7319_09715 [Clostridiales bacterium]|nr:hypothetical protein [Clostridiales bacterium]
MKRMMSFVFATFIFCCLVSSALAETVGAQQFDWTPILTAVIGVAMLVAGTSIRHVWNKYVLPWLMEKNLVSVAESVVYAVEAILGRYCGTEKWALALEKMQARGFNVESDIVIEALKAAWKKLDLQQLLSGEKVLTEPPDLEGNEKTSPPEEFESI